MQVTNRREEGCEEGRGEEQEAEWNEANMKHRLEVDDYNWEAGATTSYVIGGKCRGS